MLLTKPLCCVAAKTLDTLDEAVFTVEMERRRYEVLPAYVSSYYYVCVLTLLFLRKKHMGKGFLMVAISHTCPLAATYSESKAEQVVAATIRGLVGRLEN